MMERNRNWPAWIAVGLAALALLVALGGHRSGGVAERYSRGYYPPGNWTYIPAPGQSAPVQPAQPPLAPQPVQPQAPQPPWGWWSPQQPGADPVAPDLRSERSRFGGPIMLLCGLALCLLPLGALLALVVGFGIMRRKRWMAARFFGDPPQPPYPPQQPPYPPYPPQQPPPPPPGSTTPMPPPPAPMG